MTIGYELIGSSPQSVLPDVTVFIPDVGAVVSAGEEIGDIADVKIGETAVI